MYQFYYADEIKPFTRGELADDIRNYIAVTAIRPAMWEEHCLECSAPACFSSCAHYLPRRDGRCKRFENGLLSFYDPRACCGRGARVRFRKWANMMTVLFPGMLVPEEYQKLTDKNEKRGRRLKKLNDSGLPRVLRWNATRTVEYLRRRSLRKMSGSSEADAFVFHGFSYHEKSFRLILEVFDDHTSVFRTSFTVNNGENLKIIPSSELSPECMTPGRLVKVYPENDIEAELDILWCDFVRGAFIDEKPAPFVKCVAWDLDNTVWDGILIESDPDSLQLREGVSELIHCLDERGILQTIASKNDAEQAMPVLERLGIAEFFLYPQINWDAKSESIRTAAKLLNIGVDTFALIDDSAFERAQVSDSLPQVRTYDASDIASLSAAVELSPTVTEESRNRRQMYRAEEKRSELMAKDGGDTIGFLRKCHLHAELFEPKAEEELARCYELLIRTNQLNMSGRKYSEAEFREVLSHPDHTAFAFSCGDDFGDYGIVGFGQYRKADGALEFTEFAMSCRVAGKYVESAVFRKLLEKEDLDLGSMNVIKTRKNLLLRSTLEKIGFALNDQSESYTDYRFGPELENSDIVSVVLR